jgi:heme A synthase
MVLAYTVIVIAWGAYVRATGSGAGCGEHWPLCNGEIIPREAGLSRMIEFSHRLSSGLSLVLVVGLVAWSRKIYAKGHVVRKAAALSLAFILGEAAVGAMLVILKLVAGNDSVLRAVVIALHLINTFFLLFWLVRTAFESQRVWAPAVEGISRARFNIWMCMIAFAVTGAAGAIVALGDTLFPATSLSQGLAQDFSEAAHFLIRLRIWHPVIAVLTAGYVILQGFVAPKIFAGLISAQTGRIVALLVIVQVIGGIVNWLLLAPIWMQIFHLIFADIVWISLCWWLFLVGRNGDQNQKTGGAQ